MPSCCCMFEFCAAEAECLNCTWLSRYCWPLNDLSQCLHLTVALLSLTVFSNVDVMSYSLPSFNSTNFRKPQLNKVRFIFHNSSKFQPEEEHKNQFFSRPCSNVSHNTLHVYCPGDNDCFAVQGLSLKLPKRHFEWEKWSFYSWISLGESWLSVQMKL